MKIDGRDSAEYQNWENRDMNVIFRKVFKSQNAKNEQCHLLKWAVLEKNRGAAAGWGFSNFFRERATSL